MINSRVFPGFQGFSGVAGHPANTHASNKFLLFHPFLASQCFVMVVGTILEGIQVYTLSRKQEEWKHITFFRWGTRDNNETHWCQKSPSLDRDFLKFKNAHHQAETSSNWKNAGMSESITPFPMTYFPRKGTSGTRKKQMVTDFQVWTPWN